jgi:predicted DNA-binding transcriptional regulator AlpA
LVVSPPPQPDRVIRFRETATICGFASPGSFRDALNNGRLPGFPAAIKVNGRRRGWLMSAVQGYLVRMSREAAEGGDIVA